MHQRNQDAIYKREMPNDEAVPGLTEILWQDKQDGWEVGAQNFLTQLQHHHHDHDPHHQHQHQQQQQQQQQQH